MSARYPTKRQLPDTAQSYDELLTSNELADRLKIHRLTPVIWRRERRGPPFIDASDARLVRYRWNNDVLPWLEKNRKGGDNE